MAMGVTMEKKSDSYIEYNKEGHATSFVGPRAVDCFRIARLSSSIGLLSKGIQPTRGFTMTKALKMATEYTGKKYKRTEFEQARLDLNAIVQKEKAELSR